MEQRARHRVKIVRVSPHVHLIVFKPLRRRSTVTTNELSEAPAAVTMDETFEDDMDSSTATAVPGPATESPERSTVSTPPVCLKTSSLVYM